MRLTRNFFEQKTLKVAKELLGCFLIRKIGKKRIIGRIIETEAYCGPKDLANHASKGRTKRTEVMFGPAGHAYVYLIYGMYYCFNIVTENTGYPGAVLIRGIEIQTSKSNIRYPPAPLARALRAGAISDSRKATIIGPGKVCREMKIDKKLNGVDLINNKQLYIMDFASNRVGDGLRRCPPARVGDGPCRRPVKIKKLPRVGVDYAGEYKDKKWRFVLK